MEQITRKLMMMYKGLYLCQGKKEEEDSPALRIVLIHQYKDSRNALKKQRKTNFSSY